MSTAPDIGNNADAASALPIAETVERPLVLPPNFDGMPNELKPLKNWVVWKYLPPKSIGGKWRKVPFQSNGTPASTTDPATWSTFDECYKAYAIGAFSGIGIVFDGVPDENGLSYAGIDFDHVISKGEIHSLAAERIKRIGSYTERSVSGDGIHVIVKAHPLASGISQAGTEMYTQGRFFVMTGRGDGEIVAAPEMFAALAAELRSQGKDCGTQAEQPRVEQDPSSEQTDTWLDTLPIEKRSEVIRYAALHIANNSKMFELSKHGGDYQNYLRLAFAIARSGADDAEDIFVEAASSAQDADPEHDLRKFFQECQNAERPGDGVTVGSLLRAAIDCDADFAQWKSLAAERDPEVAMFAPGNEEACRELLARVVAADQLTYTLGDASGPLMILRIPDKEALPEKTRWEGDLPGTSLAAAADVMERAERITWMKKGRWGPYRIRPPRDFVSDYLVQMRGRYGARALRGIVRVPSISDGGEIRFCEGYDSQTGLFHDRSLTFPVAPNPTLDDARHAAGILLYPFSKYQFDDPVAGQALLLAAMFTAIERPFLPVAPMFVVRSSMPGTGKGLIIRALVRLAFDTAPVFITWGGSGEEFEKRLAALLLQTPSVLSIDNANGMQIKGDLLESIITEGCADIRPLGHSKIIKVRNRSLVTLTGNNPIITGDMARRSLSIDILPRSSDPERDPYPFNPADLVQQRRADFLMAAFVVMRAFRLAGMPRQGLPAVGSFDDWGRKVRDLVYSLTNYDVSEAFRRNKEEDPRRQSDASLLAALHQHFGTNPFKAADPINVHKLVTDHRRSPHMMPAPTSTERTLHEAIEDVLSSRDVNAKVFGYWARRVRGARNGGFVLQTHHNPTTNANDMTVQPI